MASTGLGPSSEQLELPIQDARQSDIFTPPGGSSSLENSTSTTDHASEDDVLLTRVTSQRADHLRGQHESLRSPSTSNTADEETDTHSVVIPRARRGRNLRSRLGTSLSGEEMTRELLAFGAESSSSGISNSIAMHNSHQPEHVDKDILLRLQMQALELKGLEADSQAISKCIEELDFKPCGVLLYSLQPSDTQTDVWPDMENFASTPARLTAMSSKSWSPPADWNYSQQKRASSRSSQVKRKAGSPTWPQGGELLPLEVYDIIVQHLCRDDIKALRLTCKTVEYSVSRFLFSSVVVTFNDEIYGMLRQGDQNDVPESVSKGKSRARQDLPWYHPSDHVMPLSDKLTSVGDGHAVDVFRSFGAHMKKFGMSFEVDEQILASLPDKTNFQALRSYWGEYDWPYVDYQRFKDIARIERTADDIPVMLQAFSSLKRVEELSLAVDAGTGWLCGPDVSLYHRVFDNQGRTFEQYLPGQNRRTENQHKLWALLKSICKEKRGDIIANAKVHHESIQFSQETFSTVHDRGVYCRLTTGDAPQLELQSLLDFTRSAQDLNELKEQLSFGAHHLHTDTMTEITLSLQLSGLLAFDESLSSDSDDDEPGPLQPVALTTRQKEWLIETQWAQRAFISSYVLAIMDNASTFSNVHTLSLSRISTSYLNMLNRDDFWDSLPLLKSLTILAIGEWQELERDEAGYVESKPISPSAGCYVIENLLTDIIAPRRNIKALNIGWSSGGEHARGAFDRNQHLLPSPIMPSRWRTSSLTDAVTLNEEMILFPFLEHLTLTNSWVLPSVLKLFVQAHCTRALERLTLHSISLTKNLAALDRVLVLERYTSSLQQHPPDLNRSPVCPPQKVVTNMASSMAKATTFQILKVRQTLQELSAMQIVSECSRNSGNITPPEPAHAPFELHRDGSWPDVLDAVSPGVVVADMLQGRGRTSILVPGSHLRVIDLRSCGYCNITPPNVQFDGQQMALTPRPGSAMARRSSRYSKQMLQNKCDDWFGTISQYLTEVEEAILQDVWNMQIGWTDEEARLEVFYDGFLMGGEGRFSGRIEANSVTRRTGQI